jgi:hypothetical protein
MQAAFTEISGIERENAYHGTRTGRRTSSIANGFARIYGSALDPVRDRREPNDHVLILECRSCGARWSNVPGPDGEFKRGFWRCPRGCDW